MPRPKAKVLPWWLAGDAAETAEECPHCLATYALEVEVRCVDCDGPMCPLCGVVVRETTVVREKTLRCTDCHAPPAGEG